MVMQPTVQAQQNYCYMRTERKSNIIFILFSCVCLSLLVFFPIIESCESLGDKLNRKGREAKISALLFFGASTSFSFFFLLSLTCLPFNWDPRQITR